MTVCKECGRLPRARVSGAFFREGPLAKVGKCCRKQKASPAPKQTWWGPPEVIDDLRLSCHQLLGIFSRTTQSHNYN